MKKYETFRFGAGYHYRSAISHYEEMIDYLGMFPSFNLIEVCKSNEREIWQSISGTYTLDEEDYKLWTSHELQPLHNSYHDIYMNRHIRGETSEEIEAKRIALEYLKNELSKRGAV